MNSSASAGRESAAAKKISFDASLLLLRGRNRRIIVFIGSSIYFHWAFPSAADALSIINSNQRVMRFFFISILPSAPFPNLSLVVDSGNSVSITTSEFLLDLRRPVRVESQASNVMAIGKDSWRKANRISAASHVNKRITKGRTSAFIRGPVERETREPLHWKLASSPHRLRHFLPTQEKVKFPTCSRNEKRNPFADKWRALFFFFRAAGNR